MTRGVQGLTCIGGESTVNAGPHIRIAGETGLIAPGNAPRRPIASRRPLYEAVLAVEREGACVVERRLALLDVVLTPCTGLVVADNGAAQLVGWGGGGGGGGAALGIALHAAA